MVSSLRQHGRCRACGAEIPISALLVELGCALVCATVARVVVG